MQMSKADVLSRLLLRLIFHPWKLSTTFKLTEHNTMITINRQYIYVYIYATKYHNGTQIMFIIFSHHEKYLLQTSLDILGHVWTCVNCMRLCYVVPNLNQKYHSRSPFQSIEEDCLCTYFQIKKIFSKCANLSNPCFGQGQKAKQIP